MEDRLNVLMIVIDQFRADLLANDGLGQIASLPNLRALRDQSVSFEKHYSVVTPCGPSRVSLLTGQYAMNHRAVRNGTPLRHDTPNLATEVRKLGYAPKLFGYTDTTQDPRVVPLDDPRMQSYEELMPGFEEVVRMRMEGDDTAWREHLAGNGITLSDYPDQYRPAGDKVTSPAIYPADLSDTAFLTDAFLDWLGATDPGWFALLTYIRPHPPFVAPAPYNDMYAPADMPAAMTGEVNHPFLSGTRAKTRPAATVVGFPDLPDTDETVADLRAVYLGLATEVDHHIGRVIDALKEVGLWDNTLLILTSDHGEMLGDHGLWGKGTYHDAAFHVPLFIRDPARPEAEGRVVDAMTESIDVAPTILARLGATSPDSMDGQSLLPAIEASTAPGREVTMSEYDFGHPVTPTLLQAQSDLNSREANLVVLRKGTQRLVQFGCDWPQLLFDLDRDGEARNLANEPGYGETALDLSQRLLRHRLSHADGTFAHMIVGSDGLKTGTA